MPGQQQMSVLNDPDQIQCREGFVPIIRGTTGVPACVNPSTWVRLADRGWGNFDVNMMANNPQHMQSIMNSMMNNPQTGKLWYDIMANNPQHMQSMMEQVATSMQNPSNVCAKFHN